MRIRKIAISAGVLGLAMVGGAFTASPAQAYTKTCNVDQTVFYSICFDGGNDSFTVNDMRADGERAVIKWYAYDGSGREGECQDANGALNGAVVCDYDFKEGPNNYVAFMGFTRDGASGPKHNASWAYTGYITPR
ncbi:hypothetical protein [Streptomyces sp. NPDC007070]|uniref:hypothetical protein n=1 Tax=Streptomyces sp. NPDC007070 TaxID=3154312 RepID=UPI0033D84839